MQNVKRLSRKIKVKLSRKIKLSQPINLLYYSNMCFQAGLTREEIVKRRRRVSSRNARRTNFAQRQASLLLKAAIQPRITNSVVLRTARALMVRDYSTIFNSTKWVVCSVVYTLLGNSHQQSAATI